MEAVSVPFIKFMRTDEAEELMKHPNCFVVLALIAQRARRDVATFNPNGLQIGEALVGDFAAVGLTRQQFRTALANLQKWSLITTRATTKGTIAKLCGSGIYDINSEAGNQQANQQLTSNQPAANQQLTTKKNVRKKEGKKEGLAADAAPSPSLHQAFTALYSDWYFGRYQVRPKLNGADGKAVKELSQHLKTQSQSKNDDGALNGLRYVLENWDKVEPFYQKQHSLTQINANINNVLAGIKKATADVGKKPRPVGGNYTQADVDAMFCPKPAEEPRAHYTAQQPVGKSTLQPC